MSGTTKISDAISSAGIAVNNYKRMSTINDEHAFRRLCQNYDMLLGIGSRVKSIQEILLAQGTAAFYFDTTITVMQETRLTLQELLKLTDQIIEHNKTDKQHSRKWAARKLPINLVAWARYIDFEPEWHMKKRGDTRQLPNIKGKNLWAHLLKLYTDPEQSRMQTPEHIKKIAHLYPGYIECCKRAIRHGQDELKRLYGNEVDLTPLVDKRKEEDVNMVNLFNLISSGEMGAVLRTSNQ